jgi:hypothetical protein
MKVASVVLSLLLLMPLSVPARADFKYTDTSQITGGALMGMAKFAAKFSKDSRDAFQPTVTTHYLKDNRLRTDNAEGFTEIIDLDGRRFIKINNKKKEYSVATFEEIKASLEKAQQDAQQKMQQQGVKKQDAQLNVKPKITVLPGSGGRVILGQNTNETKVQMDMEMQSTPNGQPAAPTTSANPNQPNSITFSMTMDTWVAPDVPGYREMGLFYQRMAKELNWIPPINVRVDPRMTQGMEELQKNSSALKGLPLLSYISMFLPPQQGQSPSTAQDTSRDSARSNSSGSNDGPPTNASDAVVKSLGGLFGKKKQQQDKASSQSGSNSAPPNPNSNPNALIEMTTQVNSFSDSTLDPSLFEIPAGYVRIQENPDQIINNRPPK